MPDDTLLDPGVRAALAATGAVLPSYITVQRTVDAPEEYRPGRMPRVCYEGIWAHHLIGLHYKECNPRHSVHLDVDVQRILARLGSYATVPHRMARTRPDIHDDTLHLVWEVKSLKRQMQGRRELEAYRNALGAGVYVGPGGPTRGTEGKVRAPGGFVSFGLKLSGVIAYEYVRGPASF